ncbi:MAG: hypothetical protein SNJ54_12990, partial [Anaerolineae bacterium]
AAPEGCYFEPAPPPTPTAAPADDDIDDCPPDDYEMIPTSRPLFSNEIRYDPCDEWWREDSRD